MPPRQGLGGLPPCPRSSRPSQPAPGSRTARVPAGSIRVSKDGCGAVRRDRSPRRRRTTFATQQRPSPLCRLLQTAPLTACARWDNTRAGRCPGAPAPRSPPSPGGFGITLTRQYRRRPLWSSITLRVVPREGGKQRFDRHPRLGRMPQDGPRLDAIHIGSPLPCMREIAVLLQIGNDLLDGPLGKPAPRGDVTYADAVILGDRGQHPGMAGEERPSCVCLGYSTHAPQFRT
ncbi:hypothetical protein M2283_009345 [Streptomyces pseudovenezuelae]|uniref:Uncharacterized protein n=1 Tax=Streptomyces pseudovenezuelae TaxID=67350 RepID=A0ABT6M0H1_9ACTN|nr:hypothetical protein [Streptomyces pseudovenezuelae]